MQSAISSQYPNESIAVCPFLTPGPHQHHPTNYLPPRVTHHQRLFPPLGAAFLPVPPIITSLLVRFGHLSPATPPHTRVWTLNLSYSYSPQDSVIFGIGFPMFCESTSQIEIWFKGSGTHL
ncbi:hypothetical protein L1887_39432 [Cichorium endivia]|nr:hypothetical protein L1887_39432 [Cichorium endivia]